MVSLKYIIETEWYKRHRPENPDKLDTDFLRGYGEFGTAYELSFEKHLKRLRKK